MKKNLLFIILINLLILTVSAERLYEVTFYYEPFLPVQSVAVAGSFNNWDKTSDLMNDDDRDGIWTLEKKLPPGKHYYKFVINDQDWIKDKTAREFAPDGFGGENSVILVGNFDYLKKPAKRGDGKIIEEALFFDTSIQYFNPISEDRLLLIFQSRENDINRVTLIKNPEQGSGEEIPMHFLSAAEGLDYYEAIIKVTEKKLGFLFKVEDGGKTVYYDSKGISKSLKPENAFAINLNTIQVFKTPDWVKHAVFYQIFPERFHNGDPANDQNRDNPRPEGALWNISDSYLESWDTGKPSWGNYFGGDLKGIEDKLPYLEELGITAIYFNPIFESLSNHKYDTIDYYLIDDNFGTNSHFKSLVQQLKSKGIRVVLDGVFNHTADEFIQFEDIRKHGPESPYYNWYYIKTVSYTHLTLPTKRIV